MCLCVKCFIADTGLCLHGPSVVHHYFFFSKHVFRRTVCKYVCMHYLHTLRTIAEWQPTNFRAPQLRASCLHRSFLVFFIDSMSARTAELAKGDVDSMSAIKPKSRQHRIPTTQLAKPWLQKHKMGNTNVPYATCDTTKCCKPNVNISKSKRRKQRVWAWAN